MKNYVLFGLLVITLIGSLALLQAEYSASPTGFATLGTQENPVVISNCEDLQKMSNNPSLSYRLDQNIDCSQSRYWNAGKGFEPIGSWTKTDFSGTFDGNGYAVSNLYINRSLEDEIGLFGSVSGGQLHNLQLSNATVVGRDGVGLLVGHLESAAIFNSSAEGFLQAQSNAGGLVGLMTTTPKVSLHANVENSYSQGSVFADDGFVGGLIGGVKGYSLEKTELIIKNSYSLATVSTRAGLVGGFIGYIGKDSLINTSYSAGRVVCNSCVARGGFVARQEESYFCSGLWDSQVSQQETSACGVAATTHELKSKDFLVSEGFSLDCNQQQTTWVVDEVAGFYPTLGWTGSTCDVECEDNPSVIMNCRDLQEMKCDVEKNYVLGASIDCSQTQTWNGGLGFEPVGTPSDIFRGSFDGQDNVISGLFINRELQAQVGLFGVAAASLRNVVLDKFNISGHHLMGALVGNATAGFLSFSNDIIAPANADISHVIVQNSSIGRTMFEERVGGLVGLIEGASGKDKLVSSIVSSHVKDSHIRGDKSIGGLVGVVGGLSLINTSSATFLKIYGDQSGGLIGLVVPGTSGDIHISSSFAGVTLSSTAGPAGGFIGQIEATSSINPPVITDVYALGEIKQEAPKTHSHTGGLIGVQESGTVQNAFAAVDLDVSFPTQGGLIGYQGENAFCTASVWDVEVSGESVSACGEGLSTAQLQESQTFISKHWSLNCSDPATLWTIDESIPFYPQLAWQGSACIIVDEPVEEELEEPTQEILLLSPVVAVGCDNISTFFIVSTDDQFQENVQITASNTSDSLVEFTNTSGVAEMMLDTGNYSVTYEKTGFEGVQQSIVVGSCQELGENMTQEQHQGYVSMLIGNLQESLLKGSQDAPQSSLPGLRSDSFTQPVPLPVQEDVVKQDNVSRDSNEDVGWFTSAQGFATALLFLLIIAVVSLLYIRQRQAARARYKPPKNDE